MNIATGAATQTLIRRIGDPFAAWVAVLLVALLSFCVHLLDVEEERAHDSAAAVQRAGADTGERLPQGRDAAMRSASRQSATR